MRSFALLALVFVSPLPARAEGDVPPPVEPPAPAAEAAEAPAAEAGVDVAQRLGLGAVQAHARSGETLYLALQRGGVAVVDVSDASAPKLVRTILEDKIVTRLFVEQGRLWAVALEERIVGLDLADPKAPVPAPVALAPAPPSTTEEPATVAVKPAARAKVIAVSGGRVIFDGGSAEGFLRSGRVKVTSQKLVAKPSLQGDGSTKEMVPENAVTAVVAIEELDDHRGMGVLGRGDTARVGDLVEATDEELSERLFLPRRAPFSARLGFHARPFLGIGVPNSYPIGALVDLYGQYTFDFLPMAVSVEVAPVGFALLSQDLHYPTTVAATVTYVTDFFEVGAGAGAMFGNEGPCSTTLRDPNKVDPQPSDFVTTCETNNGATVNQVLRLGAVDGLHLLWRSSIFARPEGFVLGSARADAGVPISSRLGLFAGGGVGENGWAFGELGVRTFIGGTGGPGTWIIQTSLGGGAVFDGKGTKDASGFFTRELVGGPLVAVGMEWRL